VIPEVMTDSEDFQIIDDFLDDMDSFRKYCDDVDFKGETNPVDNIFYPGVSIDIPDCVRIDVIDKIESYFGRKIKPRMMFMRLSPDGIHAPHQAHTDATMSQLGIMLYLNRQEHCSGGTSFVSHKATGMCDNPINAFQESIWKEDTNNTDAWEILTMCPMKPNRAMIFDTNKMHRSEPIGGFGKGGEDGRLVLVFFFDLDD